jgi:cytochrome P450
VQSQDPPEQIALRSLFINAFRAQDIVAACSDGRAEMANAFERLSDAESFNAMSEIAAPFAELITSRLLGVDRKELAEFAELSDAIARRMDADLEPDQAEPGDHARQRLNAQVREWFSRPGASGMIGSLKENAKAQQIPEHYVFNTVTAMSNAAYSTAYATTGNAILTLIRHPEALDQLRDPELLDSGVEELVRFDGPAQGTSRVAVESVDIRGQLVKRGQTVLTLFAAANRDPEQFRRPNDLVLDRNPNPHLGFGWGAHSCIGAQLGQNALKSLMGCLQDLPNRLNLASPPTRRRTATLRCLEALPVALGPI